MDKKRVLLLHISDISGHKCANMAIEKAVKEINPTIKTKSIDAFNYTNPFLEKFINQLYILVIKVYPRIWDYLYDNERVLRKLRKVRAIVHRIKDKKIKKLFNNYQPDVIVCTQAFPCGMVADFKRRHNLDIPLLAVLTDYAPHGYWLNESVDTYVVPAPEIMQRFVQKDIPEERIMVLGIPIDTKFSTRSNREQILKKLGMNELMPVVLVMGGGQGIGPIREIVCSLDITSHPLQLIVVCGTNKRLYKWLLKNESRFSKEIFIRGYVENINELMSISDFIISKPGGLTTAEALSQSLPMIIVRPLPGQESLNTQFLLKAGVAFKVNDLGQLKILVDQLINGNVKLDTLKIRTNLYAYPKSAQKIAQLIISKLNSREKDN